MRLGRHLLIGLLLSLAALAVFTFLARNITGPGSVTDFDQTVATDLHQLAHESPRLVRFFTVVTSIGDPATMIVMAFSVAIVLVWWRHLLLAVVWCVAQAGGGLLNEALKYSFVRARPTFADPFVHLTSYSFPSGHSMGSFIGYGLLAYLLLISIQRRWLGITLATLLGILIAAIGFSRLFLGAHWFSDVIGGFCAGVVWLTTCITAIETVRRRRLRMKVAAASPVADAPDGK